MLNLKTKDQECLTDSNRTASNPFLGVQSQELHRRIEGIYASREKLSKFFQAEKPPELQKFEESMKASSKQAEKAGRLLQSTLPPELQRRIEIITGGEEKFSNPFLGAQSPELKKFEENMKASNKQVEEASKFFQSTFTPELQKRIESSSVRSQQLEKLNTKPNRLHVALHIPRNSAKRPRVMLPSPPKTIENVQSEILTVDPHLRWKEIANNHPCLQKGRFKYHNNHIALEAVYGYMTLKYESKRAACLAMVWKHKVVTRSQYGCLLSAAKDKGFNWLYVRVCNIVLSLENQGFYPNPPSIS